MGFCDDAEPNFDRAFKDYFLCAISNRGNASKERINVDCRGNFSDFCCWATGFACGCRESRPSEDNEHQSAVVKENDAMSKELKSAKNIYKKLLPNKSNASSIVTKMAESAMMSKCFAEKMFPSKGLKFSQGYSKAVDRLQQMFNSPAYSL